MPAITNTEKLRKYNEFNDMRRNLPHMTRAEQDAWLESGKTLREFLGAQRFIEKGWRMTKKGELKLK